MGFLLMLLVLLVLLFVFFLLLVFFLSNRPTGSYAAQLLRVLCKQFTVLLGSMEKAERRVTNQIVGETNACLVGCVIPFCLAMRDMPPRLLPPCQPSRHLCP